MARFGDYETTRELAVRGLTSIFLAQRVAGSGPATAVLKVLQLPESLTTARPAAEAWSAADAAGGGGHAVFVSYSTKEKDLADAVCAALEAAGIRCWMAPRDILPGTSWASSILKAIAESRAMVLVFSSHANDSPHVRREVERAVHHGMPIAPIRVEDVMPKDDMEFFLSASHWMDAITPPIDQHLGLFAERVQQMLKQEGKADAAAAEAADALAAAGPPTAGTTATAAGVAAGPSSTARAAVAHFLDAARVQQQAALTSAHWVPVYDLGEVGRAHAGGAYYAAARFGRTAEDLIENRARLTDQDLHRLVNQVVRGLADLRTALDRPHGDLKPSNVLLKGDRLDAAGIVALADPLPSAQLAPGKDSAVSPLTDLRSIGRLIVWLVAGRADEGKIAWPVPPGPVWAELGPTGDEWRGLANLLLDPRPPADLWLDQVCGRIEGLCPIRRRRRRRRVPLAVGVAVAAAAAVGVPSWLYYARVKAGRNDLASPTAGTGKQAAQGQQAWPPPPSQEARPTVVAPTTGQGSGPPTPPPTPPTPPAATVPPPAPDASLVQRLWAASNPAAPFKVSVVPQVGPPHRLDETCPCVSFAVSVERECHVLILAKDPAGDVSLLLPNAQMDHCLKVPPGTTVVPPKDAPYWFPVSPPYGRTRLKVIATTRLIQFVEANPGTKPGTTGPAADGGSAPAAPPAPGRLSTLCVAGLPHQAADLSELLDPGEWATAEVDLLTQPPDAPASAGGAAAASGQGAVAPGR